MIRRSSYSSNATSSGQIQNPLSDVITNEISRSRKGSSLLAPPGPGADPLPQKAKEQESLGQDGSVKTKDEMKAIWRIGWPVSVSFLSSILMELTDISFLGHLGTDYLAGASLAWVWQNITATLVWSAANAVSTLGSQAIGSGNKKLAGIWLQLGMAVVSVICIPVMISWFFTAGVLKGVGMNEYQSNLAGDYAQYSLMWVWPQAMFTCVRLYFESQQIVIPTLVISIVFVGVNFGLNWLLVIGISGYGGYGFVGSPIATTITRWLQFGVFILYMVVWRKLHKDFWPGWTRKSVSRKAVAEFLGQAVPNMIGSAMEEWQLQIVTMFAGRLGAVDIAAQSALFNIFFTSHCIVFGITRSASVRVGFYLGANQPENAKKSSNLSIFLASAIGVVVGLSFFLFRDFVGQIYSSDPQVWELVSSICWLIGVSYLLLAVLLVQTSVLIAQGRPGAVAIATASCTWMIGLPSSYLLSFSVGLKLLGLWLGMSAGYLLFFFVASILLVKTDWKKMAQEAVQRSQEVHHSRDNSTLSPTADQQSPSNDDKAQPLLGNV